MVWGEDTSCEKRFNREALEIVKQANTGNITPRLREDGLHDFVVNGLRCDACGGEIFADFFFFEYPFVLDEKNRDGHVWWCKNCGEVGPEGKPSLSAYKKEIVKRHNTGNVDIETDFLGSFSFRRTEPCSGCGDYLYIEEETITEENPDGEPFK